MYVKFAHKIKTREELAAILGPLWGRLAERVGMKIMVQRILLVIAIHWGLMYFVTNVWQMLGLRIFLGLSLFFGNRNLDIGFDTLTVNRIALWSKPFGNGYMKTGTAGQIDNVLHRALAE